MEKLRDHRVVALNRGRAEQKFRIFIFGTLAVLLPSCMHVGMMGIDGGHHSGSSNEAPAESILEKEIVVGDIRAIATFPPLEMDTDVVVRLRLVHTTTSAPVSDATVYFHAVYLHAPEATAPHNHGSGVHQPKGSQEINIDQEVKESSEAGVYAIPYSSSVPGEHTLMFHIAALGDRKFAPELVIEAKRTMLPKSPDQSTGMKEMSGTATYLVIGGVVMTAAMVAMLAARGHLF